ncbi:MAG: LysM peptidoglycan-binding domain-containing protein [Planctomycetes bacterium]|nr:LysM peptidoglycan-binding domain-containing protein [Planctomycetota bacterium]
MRTEVKAGIVIGLVVIAGAIIWSVSSSQSGKEATKIPFELTEKEATPSDKVGVVSNESAPPRRIRPSDRTTARPGAARPAQPRTTPRQQPTFTQPPVVQQSPGQQPPTAAERPYGTPTTAPTDDQLAESPPPTLPRTPDTLPPAVAEQRPDSAADAPGLAGRMRELHRPSGGSQQYTIAIGDTLISIAREHYGDGRYWTAIQLANPDVDPLRLKVGQVLVLPPKDTVTQPASTVNRSTPEPEKPPRAGRATYVVAAGDTLTSIARNVLGDGERWREIFELNQDKLESPDLLREGIELRMPASETKRVSDDKG